MKSKIASLNANSRFGYLIRRCFAFGLDWYLVALCSNLLILLLQSIVGEVILSYQGIVLVGSVFLASFLYYILIPSIVWKGQTLMQRAMQVKVVHDDGTDVTLVTLMKRFFIGCLVFEGALYSATTITLNVVIVTYFMNIAQQVDFVCGGLLAISTVLSLIIASRDINNSKCFHDHFAHTKVIDVKSIS